MREIKFRGKRLDNGEWVYGGYVKDEYNNAHIIFTNELGAYNAGFKPKREDYVLNYYEVDGPETVGQYVDILDAYEGDVLEGSEANEFGDVVSWWYGLVKYNDEKSRIMVFDLDEEYWYEVDDYLFDEVVDNVHDNPRLLEVKG